jgi:very-short-patch-repair endonuclease
MNEIEAGFYKAFYDYGEVEKKVKCEYCECRVRQSKTFQGPALAILISGEGFAKAQYTGIIYLMPQYKIEKYSLDFMAIMVADYKEYRDHLAIEIDGHDFHEKTKEQAAHDKKRDRVIVANGNGILRFTGSEIVRDVESCIEEIITCFCKRFSLS